MIIGVGLNQKWQNTEYNYSLTLSNMITWASDMLYGRSDMFGEPFILFVLKTMMKYDTPVEKIVYLASEVSDCVDDYQLREAGLTENMLYVVNLLKYDEDEDDYMDYINKIAANRLAIQIKVTKLEAVNDQMREYSRIHALSESDIALNTQYGVASMLLNRQLMDYRKMDQVHPIDYRQGWIFDNEDWTN